MPVVICKNALESTLPDKNTFPFLLRRSDCRGSGVYLCFLNKCNVNSAICGIILPNC